MQPQTPQDPRQTHVYPTGEVPEPHRRRPVLRRVLIGLGGAILFFAGISIGSAGGGSSTNADAAAIGAQPTATVTVTAAANAPGTKAATAPKPTPPKSTPPKPAGPKTSFGDGTWQVGKEIAAGTYSVTVPDDSLNCYWEREKNLNGDFSSIIANDNVSPGGHASVTIKKTDKGFKSAGCGTWHKS